MSESSLYQLTQKLADNPSPLAVSYTTLKSVIESLLDLLIEQRLPATIWLKLPNGNYWAKKIEQYQQQGNTQQIYQCSIRKDSSPTATAAHNASLPGVTPLLLETSSHLKREIFVVILSPQFCTLILAHQQNTKNSDPHQQALTQAVTFNLIYSFTPSLIKKVLGQIKQWITITDTTPEDLLVDSDLPFSLPASPQSNLVEKLLIKQIQQTEILQNESSLINETQSTLRQLNESLIFKDQILKSLAQELSLPLTNMKTGLRLLESMQSKREQRQRYISLLQRECEREAVLLSGLQELIQLDQISAVEIDPSLKLEDLIPGIVSTYQPLAEEKGILLGYTIPPGFPAVNCPENWLRQIILSLLNNSLKFTPANGRIFVSATLKDETVELTITDTGVGIESSELPQIFKSFYRGRNAIADNLGGAGLGLTIVQHLLQRCGGTISVNSQSGKGTTFTVSLPIFSNENQE